MSASVAAALWTSLAAALWTSVALWTRAAAALAGLRARLASAAGLPLSLHLRMQLPSSLDPVFTGSRSEACLAAPCQIRMCSMSMWLAGGEAGFGCPYGAGVHTMALRCKGRPHCYCPNSVKAYSMKSKYCTERVFNTERALAAWRRGLDTV